MSNYLYNDCFKIHYAVVDALIENRITAVHSYIDEESIKNLMPYLIIIKMVLLGRLTNAK